MQERKERVQKNLPLEPVDAIFDEAHRIRREAKALHIRERQKLLGYLACFYADRQVPYDVRLIVRPVSSLGESRLESLGADCQEVAPLDLRTQKLLAYQEEMQAFTIFLKQVYLVRT